MKKYLFLFLAVMLGTMSVFFTACGDDEPASSLEKQLIGEWVDNWYDGPEDDYLDVFHLRFNSNHTGTFWVIEYGKVDITIDFKWSVNGDILTLKGNDPELNDCIFEKGRFYFVDDKLYLPDADGGGDGLVMKRVK